VPDEFSDGNSMVSKSELIRMLQQHCHLADRLNMSMSLTDKP